MAMHEAKYSDGTVDYWYTENHHFHFTTPHFHGNYEFLQVLGGRLEVTIDGQSAPLSRGQCVLVFPHQIHSYNADQAANVRVVIFSPRWISLFHQKHIGALPDIIVTQMDEPYHMFVTCCLNEQASPLLLTSCLYAICSNLEEKTAFREPAGPGNNGLTHSMSSYIASHFREHISLSDICRYLGYSYQYVSRCFNRHFGMSFVSMVNAYRVHAAMDLLRYSDKPITQIAAECGFENIRSFNRNFQERVRKSPRAYRKGL